MERKTLVITIAALVGLPMVAAAATLEEQSVVTGHTVFADMSGFDDNIAAIAGHAESRVVWFNGQTIMNTIQDGYIYAVESGASCSPLRGMNYTFQDYRLSYIDPNDVSHVVAHYTYRCTSGSSLLPGTPLDDLFGGTDVYHVWVTHTHPLVFDSPIVAQGDKGRSYNFALAVDVSEMGNTDEMTHTGEGGRTTSEINQGDSYCPDEDAHHCGDGAGNDEHTHNTAEVDLFFSKTDFGQGAEREDGGTHPGTLEGCDDDDHCVAVRDGSWDDPDGST